MRGGISRYYVELFRKLCQHHIDFRCFGGVHANQLLIEASSSTPLKDRVVHSPRPAKPSGLTRLRNEFEFRKQIKIYKPDVIHDTYYPLGSRRTSTASITTIHDMIYEKYGSGERVRLNRRMRLKAARNATRVIAVSQATKADILDFWNLEPDKIDVIYHGSSVLPEPASSPIRSPYLLFVGKRGWYKNFLPALSAFARSGVHNDFHLVCFGGGSLSAKERSMIVNLSLDGKVHYVDGDDCMLASCYHYACGLLYVSRYEGFGLPILEAMSVGCPVLALEVASIPEVAGDAALLLPDDDADALVEGLKQFAYDEDLRATLSRAGRENAKRFSWEKSANEHLRTYKRALSQV